MLQHSDISFLAFLAPIARALLVTRPLIQLRLRCQNIFAEAIREYNSDAPKWSQQDYLSEIQRLEAEYNKRNEASVSIAKSVVYVVAVATTAAVSLVLDRLQVRESLSDLIAKEPVYLAISIGLFIGVAYLFFRTFHGHKRAPTIDFANCYQNFCKEQERLRRTREEQERRAREEYQRRAQERSSQGGNGRFRRRASAPESYPEALKLLALIEPFTRLDLDRARRKLALKLHPDRSLNATSKTRKNREEKLKRVNAAYEQLKPYAR
ncbi:MAG: hypothetical protein WAN43_13755 [Rhodomicrobium sp.]